MREGRAAFLRRLVREISRPVMPQDEAFEYLPTQAVAEYLAYRVEPRLDGIIFRSSQTGASGRNLVLFNHACGVEPYDLPEDAEVRFSILRAGDDDDNDGDIIVFETVLPEPPKVEVPTKPLDPVVDITRLLFAPPLLDEDDRKDDEPPTNSTPTLRLDIKSVVVLDIKAVQYTHHRRVVSRHRNTKSEGQDS